jgi:cytochrome P450
MTTFLKDSGNCVALQRVGRNASAPFGHLEHPSFTMLNAGTVRRIPKFTSKQCNNPAIQQHFVHMLGQHSINMMNGKEWKASRDNLQKSFHSSSAASVTSSAASVTSLQKTITAAGLCTQQQLEMNLVTVCRMASLNVTDYYSTSSC